MSDDFSVLLCLFDGNSKSEITSAIQSIKDNSVQPDQVVIVVDGPLSDDKKTALIRAAKEDYFLLIWSQNNRGLIHALNVGLAHVTNTWCVRCDCDDYNHPQRFFYLKKHFLSSDLAIVGSYISELGWDRPLIRPVPLSHSDIIDLIKWRNPFNHMSVAFRTDAVKKVGGYPHIYGREDYALWLMLYATGWKMLNIDKVLVRASAGRLMLIRRSGIRHLLAEFKLVRLKFRILRSARFYHLLSFLVRCIAIISPVWMKERIWKKVRRP